MPEVKNTSGLKPLGCTVLIEHYEPERVGGMIFIPENVQSRVLLVEQRAVVIEVGPECWKDESAPRAVPGDRVLIAKMGGYMAVGPADGKQYRIVNDRDIFAAISQE